MTTHLSPTTHKVIAMLAAEAGETTEPIIHDYPESDEQTVTRFRRDTDDFFKEIAGWMVWGGIAFIIATLGLLALAAHA